MKKAVLSGVAAVAAVLLVSTSAFAQANANASVAVTANVAAKAKLTLGPTSIVFADADPDAVPVKTATAVTIDVKARASGAVTLTVLASGDLVSGSNTIGISNLTWAATGSGFQDGVSNKTTAQTVGSWGVSGSPSGTQTFSLPNSWTYATGTYTVTLNYTLTAP
jgi:hypothetical protein